MSERAFAQVYSLGALSNDRTFTFRNSRRRLISPIIQVHTRTLHFILKRNRKKNSRFMLKMRMIAKGAHCTQKKIYNDESTKAFMYLNHLMNAYGMRSTEGIFNDESHLKMSLFVFNLILFVF